MSTTVTELEFLHDSYVAKVNAALEAGHDELADELSASYTTEAVAMAAAAAAA